MSPLERSSRLPGQATMQEPAAMLATVHALACSGSVSTPFVVFDESEIVKTLSLFKRHLPRVTSFYAVKANPHPLLLNYFAGQGLGFDVSSAQELALVSELGVSGDRIIFTNPIKGTECLKSLFAHKVRGQTFDNVVELEKIAEFRRRHGEHQTPELYLRIRVASHDVQIDLNRKFGCAPEEAPALVRQALDLGLRPVGLAFHVGTQSYLAENFATGIRTSMLVADVVCKSDGIALSLINIGGGFPDPMLAEQRGTDLDALLARIGLICEEPIRAGFTLVAEPGRVLVSAAGSLVASVIGIANRAGRRWIYLDDGIYGCYSGGIFDRRTFAFLPMAGPRRVVPFDEQRIPHVVAGPTCDSIDVVDEHVLLPRDIAVGDFVCSPNLGAYSLATACNFNGFGMIAAAFLSVSGAGSLRIIHIFDHNGETKEIGMDGDYRVYEAFGL
jgi:ornithine decarboxylase